MKNFITLILFFCFCTFKVTAQDLDIDIVHYQTSARDIDIRASDFPTQLRADEFSIQALGIKFNYTPPEPITTTFDFYISDGTDDILINSITSLTTGSTDFSMGSAMNPTYMLDYTKTYTLFVIASYTLPSTTELTQISSGDLIFKITEAFNTIYNNSICCNQITFSYPYDPNIITQNPNAPISTRDGAQIASIQWQMLIGAGTWANIPGATQLSYDPPAVNFDSKFRRVLKSSSGAISNSTPISVKKIIEVISNNSICCSQNTDRMPFNPEIVSQTSNTTISSNVGDTIIFTYQWQSKIANGVWTDILGATNSSYDPYLIKSSTGFRRIAFSSHGEQQTSNIIYASLQTCSNRPNDQENLICGDQTFYKLQHGDKINTSRIQGSLIQPNIYRREFGFDYMISYNQIDWYNISPKHLIYNGDHPYTYRYDSLAPNGTIIYKDGLKIELVDYQIDPFTFDINKGPVQHIYIRRDYYHWYDEFNCGPFNAPGRCGSQWHFKSSSNVVTITLTTGDFPKPVSPIVSSRSNVTCNWSDQTINFSVAQLNNGEYYKWTIPSTWTAYTSLEGPYVNNISVSTNSGDGNYAKGGKVCLEVTQGAQTDRQCITISGSSPTTVVLPATTQGCEGQTLVIKPTLLQNNAIANPANYNFSWQAYQSPNINCLNDCKELSVVVSNVRQNPTQAISLTVSDNLGCKASANTTLVTAPGLQMGILNSYSDPKAISNSGLAINTVNNNLYFTGQNKNIYRSYYDNTPGQLIWKYVPLKDKNTNQAILSDGPVAYYKGTTDKLFYTLNSNLYYAESTDNGLTWVDKFSSGYIACSIDARIKTSGTNIYYIPNSIRQVAYKNIANASPSSEMIVGADQVNYSQRMFTIEDGILTYADVSNNIVAFDANTGTRFTINVPSQIKQVNYNSSISTYNKNIYYTSSSGSLRILKKNSSTGIYDNYEEESNLQLAGPFAINKQTGTVYAKAYDVLGKQIYYLNNKWNIAPINSPLSNSAIQSDMTYTNEHAYYIGDYGYLSNTYYIAPCIPAVLRTSNELDKSGDIVNDPLSNDIHENNPIVFYPNPTTGIVKTTFTIESASIVQIKITPVSGGITDIIYNASVQAGTQEIPFDMSIHSAGIYIVQVYVDGSLYAKSKLIKY